MAARAKVEEAKKAVYPYFDKWRQAMLAGTLPKGMEAWFDPSFSPSRAGWKTGRAPFANNKGELRNAKPPLSNRL